MTVESPEKKEIKTLKDFAADNQSLLASLGVFAGLTTLSQHLSITILGQLLSFLCLAATILLALELRAQIPTNPIAVKLDFFKTSLYLIILVTIAYWLINFREVLWLCLFWLITLLLAVFVGRKRRQIYTTLGSNPENWKPWKRWIENAVLAVIVFILLAIGIVLSVPANSFLDAIKIAMISAAKQLRRQKSIVLF